uniref:Uncharacterized protein n=1 Tax=Knipowitschia caucasica TaxID=637954 RepID=A0AAV2KGJ3_KNICA
MLSVWCFMVFAAVGERLAVSGEEPRPEEDRHVWDWFSLGRRRDSGDTSSEVTYPKRLVQHTQTEEETAHGRLDTRINNSDIHQL